MRDTYDYLIVGAGMVADAAANGIRERDENGTIGILGEEPTEPFPRPALSKKLWTDPDFTIDNTDPGTAEKTGAEITTDTRVASIDRDAKQVTTDAGNKVGYQKLLLATGGHPNEIDGLEPGPRVIYFRTLTDYQNLRELTQQHLRVAVVGGSYIGTEIAAAMVQNGCTATLVFPEETLGASMFPAPVATEFQQAFTDAGVILRAGTSVTGGAVDGDQVTLQLDGPGEGSLQADVVVVGLGIVPAGDLAAAAGLETSQDGGIVVDKSLATEDPRVFAAGDVAEYPDRILGRRRVEHVDNAGKMGAAVGRIMAGSEESYDHTPMFYSDVFDISYEAVGTVKANLQTETVDIAEADGGGKVVYYIDDDEVVGVLLWRTGDALDQAKQVLAEADAPASYDGLITPTTD